MVARKALLAWVADMAASRAVLRLSKKAGVIQRQGSQLCKPAQQVDLVCLKTALRLVVESQANGAHYHLLRFQGHGGNRS